MSKIQALQADALSETPASPGIARHLAFQDEGNRGLNFHEPVTGRQCEQPESGLMTRKVVFGPPEFRSARSN
jgi:hypothetical protein